MAGANKVRPQRVDWELAAVYDYFGTLVDRDGYFELFHRNIGKADISELLFDMIGSLLAPRVPNYSGRVCGQLGNIVSHSLGVDGCGDFPVAIHDSGSAIRSRLRRFDYGLSRLDNFLFALPGQIIPEAKHKKRKDDYRQDNEIRGPVFTDRHTPSPR